MTAIAVTLNQDGYLANEQSPKSFCELVSASTSAVFF